MTTPTARFPGAALLGVQARTTDDFIRVLHRGMSTGAVDRLAHALDTPQGETLKLIGLSARTFARRSPAGRLSAPEGERVARLARVIERAHASFGRTQGNAWLRSQWPALGMHTPLDYAATDIGAEAVLDLIVAVEEGHFV